MVANFTVAKKEPAQAVKRPPSTQADADDLPDFRVPGAADLKKKQRLPPTAPVRIGLHTFSLDSTVFGFRGGIEPVIAAIYDHAAYPCLFFKENGTRDEFCNEMRHKDPDFPETG